MATEGKIVNLESPSSEALFPRTKVKAISDDNNVGLEVLLEGKANSNEVVPTTRTINSKALSSNISLTAADVGARASTWTPTAADIGAVPTSRIVNGKALSSNISLTAADVGARASTWMPTASDVGALPQKCAYYSGSSTVNADTCNDSFALFASNLVGNTLTKLLGNPEFIYIFTFYYADSNYKLQIAFPYNLASSAVAVRQSYSGTWKAWTRIDNHAPLTSDQYGTALPTAGTAGRLFFKKVT